MDRSLGGVYWKLDEPISKDTLCETFVHEGTKDEFSHTRDNRTIGRLQIELKSVFENYRLGIHDTRRGFEEALKKRCEALSIDMNHECPGHFYWISDHYPAVQNQYWKVKSVDENSLNELKKINRKLIKDNSQGCLIYTTNGGDSKGKRSDTGKGKKSMGSASSIFPFSVPKKILGINGSGTHDKSTPNDEREKSEYNLLPDDTSIDSRTQLVPSAAEKAGTSDTQHQGINPPSVKFFIDYDHGMEDVRQTRATLNDIASQIYSKGSLDMGLMNTLATSNKLSTHQTTQAVLDSLISCEPWRPQTEADSMAQNMSEK